MGIVQEFRYRRRAAFGLLFAALVMMALSVRMRRQADPYDDALEAIGETNQGLADAAPPEFAVDLLGALVHDATADIQTSKLLETLYEIPFVLALAFLAAALYQGLMADRASRRVGRMTDAEIEVLEPLATAVAQFSLTLDAQKREFDQVSQTLADAHALAEISPSQRTALRRLVREELVKANRWGLRLAVISLLVGSIYFGYSEFIADDGAPARDTPSTTTSSIGD